MEKPLPMPKMTILQRKPVVADARPMSADVAVAASTTDVAPRPVSGVGKKPPNGGNKKERKVPAGPAAVDSETKSAPSGNGQQQGDDKKKKSKLHAIRYYVYYRILSHAIFLSFIGGGVKNRSETGKSENAAAAAATSSPA